MCFKIKRKFTGKYAAILLFLCSFGITYRSHVKALQRNYISAGIHSIVMSKHQQLVAFKLGLKLLEPQEC